MEKSWIICTPLTHENHAIHLRWWGLLIANYSVKRRLGIWRGCLSRLFLATRRLPSHFGWILHYQLWRCFHFLVGFSMTGMSSSKPTLQSEMDEVYFFRWTATPRFLFGTAFSFCFFSLAINHSPPPPNLTGQHKYYKSFAKDIQNPHQNAIPGVWIKKPSYKMPFQKREPKSIIPSHHPMTSGGMKKGQAALEFEEATGKVGPDGQVQRIFR